MHSKVYSIIKEVWGNGSKHELFFEKIISLPNLNDPIQTDTLLDLCENDLSVLLWFSSPACPVLELKFIFNDGHDIELKNEQVSDAIKSGYLKINNSAYENWKVKTYMIFLIQPFTFDGRNE